MAKCHQCNKDISTPAPRTGPCSVCGAVSAGFCEDCGIWELGYEAGTLPEYLRKPAKPDKPAKAVVRRLTRDSDSDEGSSHKPKAPPDVLSEMKAQCKLIKDQVDTKKKLDGVEFETYAKTALDNFTKLYPKSPFDDKSMRILIVLQISSLELAARGEQETVGKRVNYPSLHRFDAPKVAVKHLQCCFAPDKGKAKPPDCSIQASFQGLAENALGVDCVDLLLKDKAPMVQVRQDLLGLAGGKAADAKKMLEVAIMLYHVMTTARKKAQLPDTISKGGFDPKLAPGYLVKKHYEHLFGEAKDDPPRFTAQVESQLGALHASFDKKAPRSPRHADAKVSKCLTDGAITDAQAAFLQSVPRMDSNVTGKAASACEREVRKRLVAQLASFLDAAKDPDWPSDKAGELLDALIVDLWEQTPIETTCGKFLIDKFAQALKNDEELAMKTECSLMAKQVAWPRYLGVCNAGGKFEGLDENARPPSMNLRGATYIDWRNDKDRWMYDCAPFTLLERPVFTSLNLSEDLPRINDTLYGTHMMVWRNEVKHRSVFTLSDHGHPRRSMLLLLRDMFHGAKRRNDKDALPVDERCLTFCNVFHRLRKKAERVPMTQKNYRKLFAAAERMKRSLQSSNIECHVFGPLRPKDHASHVVVGKNALIEAPPYKDGFRAGLEKLLKKRKSTVKAFSYERGKFETLSATKGLPTWAPDYATTPGCRAAF